MRDNQPSKFNNTIARFIHCTQKWSIAKKIGYGYAIAIGTTLIGTASGSLIAYYYEINAYKNLNLSYEQQYLLKKLENSVNKLRLHPQRLVTVIKDSIWLDLEKNRFLEDIQEINQEISEINTYVNTHPHDLALKYKEYTIFLKSYQSTVKKYSNRTKYLWQQIEASDFPLIEMGDFLQQKDSNNIDIAFEKLSDELILIINRAEIQKDKAKQNFNYARNLRLKLITVGMLLSAAIATSLALLTSRLIARPLQIVTDVAKRITQESNFQLRANVISNDEVGILAKSLNQLVNWVDTYTQELELSRQTLELRVEERTQELKQAQHTLELRVEERTQELQQALQELQETQAQLIQTEKMSSLGQMVAGIAHEVNNPVNFIYGNIECADNYIQDLLYLINLYQKEYPTPNPIITETIEDIDLDFICQDLVNLLSSMKIGAQRIREIVLSLRNFSRLDEADIKEVNVHEGIDNTLLILNHRLKLGIEIIKDYGDLPLIECYPSQLNQVFMNIINNAIDALLDLGSEHHSKNIYISTCRVNHSYIKVNISDNGPGIPSHIRKKLFDPFFTTKPVGKGTGLGLSISYKIIEKHKGRIEVFSEMNQGTEFVIILPISIKTVGEYRELTH